MPLYDYECQECGAAFEQRLPIADRHAALCSCGGSGELLISTRAGPVLFQPGWYRDIALDPMYIETPQQLRNACDANDGISVHLENSSFKVRRDDIKPGDPGTSKAREDHHRRVRESSSDGGT